MQSVSVKLIVEKEREIKNFKPEESWKILVEFEYEGTKFKAIFSKLAGKGKKFHSLEEVQKFLHVLFQDISHLKSSKNKQGFIELKTTQSLDFILNDIEKKELKRGPQAPFTTSTLQQEASRKFGF